MMTESEMTELKIRIEMESRTIWAVLSGNPNAVSILEKNLDKVKWMILSGNPNAIYLLERNLDKVNWEKLSENPNAIYLLERNLDKISWFGYQKIQMLFLSLNKIWTK